MVSSAQQRPAAEALPQTTPLDWPEDDLSGRMMDGAHRFVERQIDEAQARSARFWTYDASSAAAWNAALDGNRDRLREIIGVVDTRLPAAVERFGDDDNPALVAETNRYRVYQVRWPVLDGVTAEGLLVQPVGGAPAAHLVVVPDAGQTPEQVMGLASGLLPERQFARRLAESGCELLIPALVRRDAIETDNAQLRNSQQTWREWLYRQAFHMGRHPLGYEVQKVLAAVDSFRARPATAAKVGVVGYGEGGVVALHAGAVDTRIDGVLVSGYFDRRTQVWQEPIDRNVWSRLERFGDAEIASLILPRHLVVEHAAVPSFTSSKGTLQTPDGASVRAEFARIPAAAGFPKPSLVIGRDDAPVGPVSAEALAEFAMRLGFRLAATTSGTPATDARRQFAPLARHRRAAREIEGHVQGLVRAAEHVRDRGFLHAVLPELTTLRWSTEKARPTLPPEKFIEGARAYRERFRVDGVGVFDAPYLPLNPRSRKVAETARWTAWDVVLDVWPDVFAWGVIVVPKDITPGERRPVVVVQHGRNGCRATRSIDSRPRTTTSVRRWPTVGSSSSRRTTCIAARTAIAGSIARPTPSGRRSSRSSWGSTTGSSTGSGRCPSWTRRALRSTASATVARRPYGFRPCSTSTRCRFARATSISGRAKWRPRTSRGASCRRSSGRCPTGTGATPSTTRRWPT